MKKNGNFIKQVANFISIKLLPILANFTTILRPSKNITVTNTLLKTFRVCL